VFLDGQGALNFYATLLNFNPSGLFDAVEECDLFIELIDLAVANAV
jgi:hypothetical protein